MRFRSIQRRGFARFFGGRYHVGPTSWIYPMPISQSQALARNQLFAALQDRNVEAVAAVAPKINWIQMYVESLA